MSNNKNAYDLDGDQVKNKTWKNDVVRATVLDVFPNRHAVRVNPRGDNSPVMAPVLTPMYGSTMLPDEGSRVTLLYIASNVPIVLGGIYLTDGEQPPDLEVGDIRLGNGTGAHVTVKGNGDVVIESSADGDVYIDGTKQ